MTLLERAHHLIKSVSPLHWLWSLLLNLDRHNALSVASSMAFEGFLSLIPLLAIAGVLLDSVRNGGGTPLGALLDVAPLQVRQLAGAEFLRLSNEGAAAVPPISVFAFLWVTSSGLSAAMAECETIFVAPKRSWWRRRLIAIGCILAALVLLALVTLIVVALARFTGGAGTRILVFAAAAAVSYGVVVAFFRIAVRRPQEGGRRRIFVGAGVTVILWIGLSVLFSLYVSKLARYVTLYGGLAAVAILLVWLWVLSLSLLIGGEVNAQLEGVRDPPA